MTFRDFTPIDLFMTSGIEILLFFSRLYCRCQDLFEPTLVGSVCVSSANTCCWSYRNKNSRDCHGRILNALVRSDQSLCVGSWDPCVSTGTQTRAVSFKNLCSEQARGLQTGVASTESCASMQSLSKNSKHFWLFLKLISLSSWVYVAKHKERKKPTFSRTLNEDLSQGLKISVKNQISAEVSNSSFVSRTRLEPCGLLRLCQHWFLGRRDKVVCTLLLHMLLACGIWSDYWIQ